MKHLFYLYFLVFSLSGLSSTKKDSLLDTWKNETLNDSIRLGALNEVSGSIFRKTNPDSSYYYAQVEYKYALQNNLQSFQAAALYNQGHALRLKGNPRRALEVLSKSLLIYNRIGDMEGLANNLHLIGTVFFDQVNYDKSLIYIEQALKIRLEYSSKYDIAKSYNTLGYWHDENGNYDQALVYHNQCLDLRKTINDQQGISWCYNNIARVYFHQEEFLKAELWYKKSIDLKEKLNDYTIGETKGNLGFVYLKTNRVEEAIQICEEGLAKSEDVKFEFAVRLNCDCLYKGYKLNGDNTNALFYYEYFIQLRDSLVSTENSRNLMQSEMEYKYNMREALASIESKKRIELAEEKEQKQKIISYSVAGGAIALIVIIFIIFRSLKKAKKQKEIIKIQKDLVDVKNNEIMDSINYAKRIQEAILTPQRIIKNWLPNSFVLYKPKDVVAGDFYWIQKRDDLIIFAAADCTGHGVPGAMVSVVCNNALNRTVREFGINDPGQILDKTRELVIEQFEKSEDEVKDGMDISLCALDLKANKLKWSGANNPLWIVRDNEILITKADKQPIASHFDPKPFTTHNIELKKDDCIYLFTDGYTDQFGGLKNKKFKTASFKQLLLKIKDKVMADQSKIIDDTFEEWRGDLEQVDDVCVIGVRI